MSERYKRFRERMQTESEKRHEEHKRVAKEIGVPLYVVENIWRAYSDEQ